jgi:hypothetical protein
VVSDQYARTVPPPRPVVSASSREELCSLLYEAAELEHGLACSYLFAAFSLKRSEADGLTPEQVDAVRRWNRAITGIAEEEMLHLALVCNLLTALGSAPHLGRPPFPQTSRYYPAGIVIGLRRFDEETLNRFIFLERPDDVEPEDEVSSDPAVDLDHEVPAVAPGALVDDRVEPRATGPMTVGQLYEAIDSALCTLVEARGEADVFIGPPPSQATGDHFGFSELAPVTDLASARRGLDTLVSQGEGMRGDWQDAHYGQFLAVRDELRQLRVSDPGFEPAWPVVDDPVIQDGPQEGGQGTVVTDEATVATMRLASASYTVMTEMLSRYFAHTDESDEQLQVLAGASVDLMARVIGPLGTLLATLPAGAGDPSATAGSSFELHRTVNLLPHRTAAWLVFCERLTELGDFAGELAGDEPGSTLVDVAAALRDVADRLRPHLDRAPLRTG